MAAKVDVEGWIQHSRESRWQWLEVGPLHPASFSAHLQSHSHSLSAFMPARLGKSQAYQLCCRIIEWDGRMMHLMCTVKQGITARECLSVCRKVHCRLSEQQRKISSAQHFHAP